MEKCEFHSNFHAINMNGVDFILGYHWMESIGIVNVNVQKDFLKIWYNEKKITLQDMYLTNQEGPIGKSK
jgi:hypothetical protein